MGFNRRAWKEFSSRAYEVFRLDEVEYLIIPEKDVLAVVENGKSKQ